jgi:hypothetical protein
MKKTNAAATDHDVVAAEAVAPDTETAVQVTDSEGVTHTLRNPERCLVFHPSSRRFAVEHGMVIQEESKLGNALVSEGLVDDVDAALVTAIALTLGQTARQHDLQVIRVGKSSNGPAVASALRDAGFYVVEFGE